MQSKQAKQTTKQHNKEVKTKAQEKRQDISTKPAKMSPGEWLSQTAIQILKIDKLLKIFIHILASQLTNR